MTGSRGRWIGGCVLTVALLVMALPAIAGAKPWKIDPSPNVTGSDQNLLNGVSCTSSGACFAVGEVASPQATGDSTLALRWDGGRWSIVATPAVPSSSITNLAAVSCTTPAACTAVGDLNPASGGTSVLAERWNGASWQLQSPVNPAAVSLLFTVSCPEVHFCMAGGGYLTNSGTSPAQVWAERWNGASWTADPPANPPGAGVFSLAGLSCPVRSWCMGVISSASAVWNGTLWVPATFTAPAGGSSVSPASVSCTSAKFCIGVGSYSNSNGQSVPLADEWNGSTWQSMTAPVVPNSATSVLKSVSCVTTSNCTAVGYWSTSSATFTLIEHWNGTAWRIRISPNVAGASASVLDGVSCQLARGCRAVGQSSSTAGTFTLTESN